MPSEESHKDSREYLREVVRSNGRLGKFWTRGQSVCVQIRHPMYGDVRFLVDPGAFGGRGCVYDAVGPKHIGDPFGWRGMGFAEFAQKMRPSILDRLSSLGLKSASEARTFVGSSEPPQKMVMTRSHLAVADKAPMAAADVVLRIRGLTDGLLVEGQKSLSSSLKYRGDNGDPLLTSSLLSLYDLLGEASILSSLFGHFLGERDTHELNRMMAFVKEELKALDESLDRNGFDITMINFTVNMLDSYVVGLSRLTSKAVMIPALSRAALVAFSEEMYYGLLETRTMAENIHAAALITGHPPDFGRWIAEFRYHDYALRELLDKVFVASPSILRPSPDMSVFHRDRFRYPPEVAWWMWHGVEKESGAPLPQAFAFDPRQVSQRTGIKPAGPDEVATNLKPEALLQRYVEVLMFHSPFPSVVGQVLQNMRVVKIVKSEFDESGYYLATLVEPITVNLTPEMSLSIAKVRFGSSLPRSPPQAVVDDGYNALMKANPYKRLMVDVSASGPGAHSTPAASDLTYLGFGLLGLVEIGQPSLFEIQRYRFVQKFVEKRDAEAKAWEVDYRR